MLNIMQNYLYQYFLFPVPQVREIIFLYINSWEGVGREGKNGEDNYYAYSLFIFYKNFYANISMRNSNKLLSKQH